MAVRDDAPGAGAGRYRAAQVFRQGARLRARAGALRPAAAVEQRHPGIDERFGRPADKPRVRGRADGGAVLIPLPDGGAVLFTARKKQVFWHVDVYGTRTSRQSDAEGVADYIGDPLPLVHLRAPLDSRTEVRLLVQHLHPAQVRIGDIGGRVVVIATTGLPSSRAQR